jgi:folate-dependent phosphoribosylglycinamide formyltransferase PurN
MRTLIICHAEAALDRDGLARWLGSFSDYAGTIAIREPRSRTRRRVAREISRIGWARFLDVVAFRAYYRFAHLARDRAWERDALEHLRARFPKRPAAPEISTASPNSAEAEAFLRERRPDLVIARCKTILAERIFSVPPLGTFVIHPGICPEYRNAHGCFWALANNEPENVGGTLLRIDRGVDTGPVFGYFRVDADPAHESHVVTQHRTVLDHLDGLRRALHDIEAGRAVPIDTAGRRSAAWGQPWLSAYFRSRRSHAARLEAANACQR